MAFRSLLILPANQKVVGSNPAGLTNEGDAEKRLFCFIFQRVSGFLLAPLSEGGLTGFDMLGTV